MLIDFLRRTAHNLGLTLWEAQREVCLAYMRGRDTVFVAPTGYGKSVCFQLAPLLLSPPVTTGGEPTAAVIIVMPTIALIRDAISKIQERFPQVCTTALSI